MTGPTHPEPWWSGETPHTDGLGRYVEPEPDSYPDPNDWWDLR